MKKLVDIFGTLVCLLKRHPMAIHLLVATLVVVYGLVGGFGFVYFEYQQHEMMKEKQRESIIDCMHLLMHKNRHIRRHMQAIIIYEGCAEEYIPEHSWTYTNCVVFAYTIMATVGFTLNPSTTGGQIFFIFFALVGIPISMLVLANIGAFIKDATCQLITWIRRKKAKERKTKFRSLVASQFGPATVDSDKEKNEEEEEEVEEADMTGGAVLVVCVLYMFVGSTLLLILRDDGPNSSFIPSIYKSFVVMTGGDFGQMSGGRLVLVLLKLLYAAVGLAIATIAIDVGSDYLKKLHNVGRKLETAANVKVWFGGKQISVKNLVNAVGKQAKMSPEDLKNFNFHDLVDNAIAEQDGTAPEIEDPQQSPEQEVRIGIESEVVPEEPTPSTEREDDTEPEPEPQAQDKLLDQQPAKPTQSAPLSRKPTQRRNALSAQPAPKRQPKREPVPSSPGDRTPTAVLHPYTELVRSKLAIPLRQVSRASSREDLAMRKPSRKLKRSQTGIHMGIASMAAAMGGGLDRPPEIQVDP